MDELIFADGVTRYASYLVTDGRGTMWIILHGLSPLETVSILGDPTKTSEIVLSNYKKYIGYTALDFISIEPDGSVKCCLKGGHDELISN